MPVFNAYVATSTRRSKQNIADSPATAGMGKVSAGGLKGREELKSLGERMGWTSHELTMREIQQMSADETLWHEAFNKDNFERAFERDVIGRHNREAMAVWDIRKAWREGVTKEQSRCAEEAGAEFASRFPTFERTIDNAHAIVRFMEEHDLDATEVSSYIKAFNALVEEGKMSLAPVQSADEFFAQHPELRDNGVPPLVATRHQREQNTAAHFAKSVAATNEASVTRVVDYPQEHHGVPTQPDRISFRKRVANMTADEIRMECEIDPALRKALDALT
jgi:hypothetical protein